MVKYTMNNAAICDDSNELLMILVIMIKHGLTMFKVKEEMKYHCKREKNGAIEKEQLMNWAQT